MQFTPFKRQRLHTRYLIVWLLFFILLIWYISVNRSRTSRQNGSVIYHSDNDCAENAFNREYDRQTPLIFVGGVPRSGTTLMRAMLDAHPLIRCGKETHVIPQVIYMREAFAASFSSLSSQNSSKSDPLEEVDMDSAVAAFILEIIVKHGKQAEHLCNKDPLLIKHAVLLRSMFANSKHIFMIRDPRAIVHSMIKRKVMITGFDLGKYKYTW